jgi:hypothetical protein
MSETTREKLLKIALVAFGAILLLVYPLGLIWPSGWVWHGGEGKYYFQMICGIYAVLGVYLIAAARNPSEHRSLISFAIWSSVVHAGIMAAQSIYDEHERGHLYWRCASTVARSRRAVVSGPNETKPARHSIATAIWPLAAARSVLAVTMSPRRERAQMGTYAQCKNLELCTGR